MSELTGSWAFYFFGSCPQLFTYKKKAEIFSEIIGADLKAAEYLTDFYSHYDEERRLLPRHGTVEFLTTMRYIEIFPSHITPDENVSIAQGNALDLSMFPDANIISPCHGALFTICTAQKTNDRL